MQFALCSGEYWEQLRRNCPASLLNQLREDADRCLEQPLLSITWRKGTTLSPDPHDYISFSPYNWPNPDTADGFPWIQRDGVINPEFRNYDGPILGEFCRRVGVLVTAGQLTGEERYFRCAGKLLKCWFLMPETAMNPNFRYAQFVPGNKIGSCWGLIDSHIFCQLLEAVGSLKNNPDWTPDDLTRLREWFTRYYFWLVSDPFAIKEEGAPTNHGTWYDAQFVTLALFLDQPELARRQLREKSIPRLSRQLLNNGLQPFEVSRTKSFHYSIFNLTAWSRLAVYGEKLGVPLWETLSDDNASLRKCYEFLLPHLLNGGRDWPYLELDRASIHGERLVNFVETFLGDSPGNTVSILQPPCMLPC